MEEIEPQHFPQGPFDTEIMEKPKLLNKKVLIVGAAIITAAALFLIVTTINPNKDTTAKNSQGNGNTKHVKVTSSGLEGLFNTLFQETELRITDKNSINHQGCKTNGTYAGMVKGNLEYTKQESNYQDGAARQNCQNQSISVINVEAYRTENDVIFRNSEDQNFKITTITTKLVTGTRPIDYLKQLFENIIVQEVSNVKEFEDYIQLGAKVETREFTGEVVVNIDKTDLKITDIDYTISSPNTTVSGLITIGYENAEINSIEPTGASELLSSVFKDISEHEKVTYGFNYDNGTRKMETLQEPPQIYVSQKTSKDKQCLLSEQSCAEKYESIKTQFATLDSFLQTATGSFCNAEEERTLEKTYVSEIKNKGRNPQNPSDHSLIIKFAPFTQEDIQKDPQKEIMYTITLNSGKQYCFSGTTTPEKLNVYIGTMDLIVQDILSL